MTATFFRFHFPALLWAAVIAVLTLLPSASLPPLPQWELLSFDTLAHAAVFGLLTFLVIRSLLYLYGRNNLWPAIGIAMALCLFFGIIIELLQTIMRMGRQGEYSDVLSNFIGQVIAVVVFYQLFHRRLLF